MKMLIAVLIGLATTSGSHPASLRDVAPQIVQVLREHGNRMAARKATGSVLIDVQSFQAAARALGHPALDEGAFLRALGPNVRGMPTAQAVICDADSNGRRIGCRVIENGVLITLESATPTQSGMAALATITWSDRRRSGARATGSNTLRLTFKNVSGKLTLQKKEILRQS